jgi:hypothetical protein
MYAVGSDKLNLIYLESEDDTTNSHGQTSQSTLGTNLESSISSTSGRSYSGRSG